MVRRFTFEEVREYFNNQDCVLLSSEYVRSKEPLTYICSCGEYGMTSFDKFKQGHRCRVCAPQRTASKLRHSIECVRKVFADNGCELLSDEYINGKSKLKYRCRCGNISYMSMSKARKGHHCATCRSKKISEKLTRKHVNPLDSENEFVKTRKYKQYFDWRRKVYEHDDYTCQCCGDRGGRINAHHLRSYAEYPEGRTDIDNGRTLCHDCHKDFHRIYGSTGFTPHDFNEYLRRRQGYTEALDDVKEEYYESI